MNRFVLALAWATTLGCSVLSSPPKPTFRYLTLSAVAAGPPAVAPRTSVTLEPIEMPGYLEGVDVISRRSNDEIERSPGDRWAEPLGSGLLRTLVADLDAGLAPRDIAVHARVDGAAQLAISVTIDRFELAPGGQAELVARWTVRSLGGGLARRGALRTQSPLSAQPVPGNDHVGPAAAAALSRTLATLADALVAEVVATLAR